MGRTWSDEEQRKNIIALRRRFMDEGLDSFMDYQILEMLLEFVSSEKLMNEKAHMLINRFGCLATVLDASIAALKDAGLNEPEIMLLKLLPSLCKRYYLEQGERSPFQVTDEDPASLMMPCFIQNSEESSVLVLYNKKGKRVFCDTVQCGKATIPEIMLNKVVKLAIRHDGYRAVFGINHANGYAYPLSYDIDLVRSMSESLRSISVTLEDYFVYGDLCFFSLRELDEVKDCFKMKTR